MLLPSLLLALLLPGPGPGDPPIKYRLESRNAIVMDLSSVGQGTQEITTSLVAFLTLTMSDTTGGRLARIVVDSGKFEGGEMMAMLPDSLTRVKPGATFRLYIQDGKIVDGMTPDELGADDINMSTMQVVPALSMLFPGHRGALVVGTTWADTTKSDTTLAVDPNGTTAQSKVASITKWTVSGKSGNDFLLDSVTSGTSLINVMGTDVEATTTGTQRLTLSATGVVHRGQQEGRNHMTMAMGANNVETSVVQTVTLSVLP